MNCFVDEIRRPFLKYKDWWQAIKQYPQKILDQHFGYELKEDDFEEGYQGFEHLIQQRKNEFIQNETGYSEVKITRDEFKIYFKTQQFFFDELEVHVSRGFVVVSGVHEEEKDELGTCTRGFQRRYMLPHDCSGRKITAYYSEKDEALHIIVKRDGGNIKVDLKN